jgi:hypothetical protein
VSNFLNHCKVMKYHVGYTLLLKSSIHENFDGRFFANMPVFHNLWGTKTSNSEVEQQFSIFYSLPISLIF